MIRLRALIALILVSVQSVAQVPGNVIGRVFQIKYSGETGTAFVLDYDDKQYFITSNHLVKTAGASATIDILGGDNTWHSVNAIILHGPNDCIDVAVLVFAFPKLVADPVLPMDNDQFVFGQEAYFLGYPYGLYTTFPGKPGVIPFTKHGYISASVSCSAFPELGGGDGDRLILMDAMNNQGFSGGPVVAPDLNVDRHPLKFVGVVKAYRNADFSNEGVAGNSGITLIVPISRAINLIEQYDKPLFMLR